MQRDYRFYLDRAKENQGFKFDNEIDKALGFKGSMTSMILRHGKHLSDDKMIDLAKLAGMDETLALIDLQIWKSNGAPKAAYQQLLNRFISLSIIAALTVVFVMFPPDDGQGQIVNALAILPAVKLNHKDTLSHYQA